VSEHEVGSRNRDISLQQDLEVRHLVAVHVAGDDRVGAGHERTQVAGILQRPGADEVEDVVAAARDGVELRQVDDVGTDLEIGDLVAVGGECSGIRQQLVDKDVVAGIAGEDVLAALADDGVGIVALAADQGVLADPAKDDVVAVFALDGVIAVEACEPVGAAVANGWPGGC